MRLAQFLPTRRLPQPLMSNSHLVNPKSRRMGLQGGGGGGWGLRPHTPLWWGAAPPTPPLMVGAAPPHPL